GTQTSRRRRSPAGGESSQLSAEDAVVRERSVHRWAAPREARRSGDVALQTEPVHRRLSALVSAAQPLRGEIRQGVAFPTSSLELGGDMGPAASERATVQKT